MSAPYVQSSFAKLEKAAIADSENNIQFTLNRYEFKDHRAHVTMTVALSNAGKVVMKKTYTSEGSSQTGKMWVGGYLAMKEGTLESTKAAIDSILAQFISDIPKQ